MSRYSETAVRSEYFGKIDLPDARRVEPGEFVMAPYVPVHKPIDIAAFHTLEAEEQLLEYGRTKDMNVLRGMNIKAKKEEVLEKLRTNRETHSKIAAEARVGYVEKAQQALNKRMAELKEGKIVGLSFNLRAPMDHTRVYDTAIASLELHQEDEITLTSDQVRHLCLDDWDWKEEFLTSNSQYSGSARDELHRYT
jgi:hypothetical protein